MATSQQKQLNKLHLDTLSPIQLYLSILPKNISSQTPNPSTVFVYPTSSPRQVLTLEAPMPSSYYHWFLSVNNWWTLASIAGYSVNNWWTLASIACYSVNNWWTLASIAGYGVNNWWTLASIAGYSVNN